MIKTGDFVPIDYWDGFPECSKSFMNPHLLGHNLNSPQASRNGVGAWLSLNTCHSCIWIQARILLI